MCLPEARLDQHTVDTSKGLLQVIKRCSEKPLQPGGDVQGTFLASFKDAVITSVFIKDARGHGIEANSLLLALSQCLVGNGAREAAVAVIEVGRVTNQKWAMPARRKGSRLASLRLLSNQARKSANCDSSHARGGGLRNVP